MRYTYLGVVGANGARTSKWTVWVTLLGIWVAVVPHLIVPGLDMVGRRAVPKVMRVCWNFAFDLIQFHIKKKLIPDILIIF